MLLMALNSSIEISLNVTFVPGINFTESLSSGLNKFIGVAPMIGQPPGPPKQYIPVRSLAIATEPTEVFNLGLLSLGTEIFS